MNFSQELGKLKNPIDSAVAAIAQAVSDKTIDISFFKDVNEDIYNQVMALSKKFEGGENKVVKDIVTVQNKWAKALEEQKLSIAESKEYWTDLHILKKKQIKESQKDSIRKLAVDANLISSEEDVLNLV